MTSGWTNDGGVVGKVCEGESHREIWIARCDTALGGPEWEGAFERSHDLFIGPGCYRWCELEWVVVNPGDLLHLSGSTRLDKHMDRGLVCP
jgi:hypothetical protein